MPEDNLPTPSPINPTGVPEPSSEANPKGFFRGKGVLALAIGGTIVLAGIAVFTAVRLYQLRQQPTTPELAQAQVPTSTPFPTVPPTPTQSLTITPTQTLSPTATVSATPTRRPSATPTAAALPDAGVSTPTIIGVTLGLILLLVSTLLAL